MSSSLPNAPPPPPPDHIPPPQVTPIYIFLDEGGNFDFSAKGTKYFTLTSVTKRRPFQLLSPMTEFRHDLIELGLDIQYFHASEDRQKVRDRIFSLLQNSLRHFRVDSVIVEKRKTHPSLQDPAKFYPKMLGYLLRYAVQHRVNLNTTSKIIVITDSLPVQKKRKAIEKSIKETLKHMLPTDVRYHILHHDSKSSTGLQIADYFNWAIFRAWERKDRRSLDLIAPAVKSQFDIFQRGTDTWY